MGAIVGGLLIFIWQTLSWTVLHLHEPSQQYHPKQDTILSFLSANIEKEGGYLMPTVPMNTPMAEAQKMGEKMQGKPWVQVQYHKTFDIDGKAMINNMVRGLLANIIMVALLIWVFSKMGKQSFFTTLIATLLIGVIVFTNAPYTSHIWYPMFDIKAHLTDALLSWGLCGIWLGWWLNRGK